MKDLFRTIHWLVKRAIALILGMFILAFASIMYVIDRQYFFIMLDAFKGADKRKQNN